MRAIDLAMFIIIMEMSLGFLTVIDFGHVNSGARVDRVMDPERGGDYGVGGTWQNRNSIPSPDSAKPSVVDYLKFGVDWGIAGFFGALQLIGAFVAISWILYTKFQIPMEICVFVQGIIYLIYTWAIIQWKAGRSGGQFD